MGASSQISILKIVNVQKWLINVSEELDMRNTWYWDKLKHLSYSALIRPLCFQRLERAKNALNSN